MISGCLPEDLRSNLIISIKLLQTFEQNLSCTSFNNSQLVTQITSINWWHYILSYEMRTHLLQNRCKLLYFRFYRKKCYLFVFSFNSQYEHTQWIERFILFSLIFAIQMKNKTSKAKEECAYKCFWMRKKTSPQHQRTASSIASLVYYSEQYVA